MEHATEPKSAKRNDLMKKITVLLVDDHPVIRSGLRALLAAAADLRVVGEAADGREAVREVLRLNPHVVLMDLAMPLLSGVEATRQISRAAPLVKILILSTYSDSQHVRAAIEAGASSYLLKSTAGETLLDLIRGSVHGTVAFSPEILNHLSNAWAGRSTDKSPPETPTQSLSPREAEILQLVAMNQIDLIEPMMRSDADREFLKDILEQRKNLRDRFNFEVTEMDRPSR